MFHLVNKSLINKIKNYFVQFLGKIKNLIGIAQNLRTQTLYNF